MKKMYWLALLGLLLVGCVPTTLPMLTSSQILKVLISSLNLVNQREGKSDES
jgi:hypothetical protein